MGKNSRPHGSAFSIPRQYNGKTSLEALQKLFERILGLTRTYTCTLATISYRCKLRAMVAHGRPLRSETSAGIGG